MTIPWNKNLNTKTRIVFFIINLVLFVLGIFISNYSFLIQESLKKYSLLVACSIVIPFSVLFMFAILDWKDKKVRLILFGLFCIIIGALGVLFFYNKNMRTMILLFIISFAALVVYLIFENVFITIFSFIVCVFISLYLILKLFLFIATRIPAMSLLNGFLGIYIATVVSLILYKVIALKLNKFLLKFFGNKEAHDLYDEKHLKNLLNVIYLFAFIIINILYYSILIDDIWFNYINNTFLTLLVIINVDWENILLLHKKVKSNETQI